MDRSIKKTIAVNELKYVFQMNDIQEADRSRLVTELFENPRANQTYLLKSHIRTLKVLEETVRGLITQQDCILAITIAFSVKDDLGIPSDLRKILFSNVPLAFFIGAGVSKLLKVPLWSELANNAIEFLKKNNYLNHNEVFQLKNDNYTAKQIISMFHKIVGNENKIKKFYEDNLDGEENSNGNPYDLLLKIEKELAKPIVKISTNIDLEWEKVLKNKKEKREQSIEGKIINSQSFYEKTKESGFSSRQKIKKNILYQIHGSLNNLDEAILTTSQYVSNYRDDNGLKGFLENIFKEYIVLFIGSGVQEFEILEHCLKQSPSEHYALIATQIGEENLFRIKKSYFSEIKIKAIPYYLDFQGYDRLLFVLQSWLDEIISGKKKQFYDDIKLIDGVL